MPELPEVERVRRELREVLIGTRVGAVGLRRRDVVHGDASTRALLRGDSIARLERRGKQLAIVGASGRVVCIHLGMSGQLLHVPSNRRPARTDHLHVVWSLRSASGDAAGRLCFRDPRRFGGAWTFASEAALHATRWSALGPDALVVRTDALQRMLGSSRRQIKAALLDQRACAGVGNIYADEALFRAGIRPQAICTTLSHADWAGLARSIRTVLRAAIRAGGSSIRDYVGANGAPGTYQTIRKVYGRGGQACANCGETLASGRVAQRATVWCLTCQR